MSAQDADDVRLPWGPLGYRRVHDICGWDVEVYDTATGNAVSVTSDFETFVEVYNLFLAALNDGSGAAS